MRRRRICFQMPGPDAVPTAPQQPMRPQHVADTAAPPPQQIRVDIDRDRREAIGAADHTSHVTCRGLAVLHVGPIVRARDIGTSESRRPQAKLLRAQTRPSARVLRELGRLRDCARRCHVLTGGRAVVGARRARRMWVVLLMTRRIGRILERPFRAIAKIRWNSAIGPRAAWSRSIRCKQVVAGIGPRVPPIAARSRSRSDLSRR